MMILFEHHTRSGKQNMYIKYVVYIKTKNDFKIQKKLYWKFLFCYLHNMHIRIWIKRSARKNQNILINTNGHSEIIRQIYLYLFVQTSLLDITILNEQSNATIHTPHDIFFRRKHSWKIRGKIKSGLRLDETNNKMTNSGYILGTLND